MTTAKTAVVAYFNTASQHLPGEMKKRDKSLKNPALLGSRGSRFQQVIDTDETSYVENDRATEFSGPTYPSRGFTSSPKGKGQN